LVWWPAVAACLWLVALAVRRRTVDDATLVALAGCASTYLPWAILGGSRGATFLFYLLPAVPFLCLALSRAMVALTRRRAQRIALAAYLVGIAASFAFFYPVLTALPLDRDAWRARLIFKDCSIATREWERFVAREGDALRERGLEVTRTPPDGDMPIVPPLAPPPEGWCWI